VRDIYFESISSVVYAVAYTYMYSDVVSARKSSNSDTEFSLIRCVSYPSGRVAISISRVYNGVYTLVVLSDALSSSQLPQQQLLAVFQSSGHAVVYYHNSQIR